MRQQQIWKVTSVKKGLKSTLIQMAAKTESYVQVETSSLILLHMPFST